MSQMRECKECGAEFKASVHNRRYCGTSCRNRAGWHQRKRKRLPRAKVIPCRHCGAEFKARAATWCYCSKQCARRARHLRDAADPERWEKLREAWRRRPNRWHTIKQDPVKRRAAARKSYYKHRDKNVERSHKRFLFRREEYRRACAERRRRRARERLHVQLLQLQTLLAREVKVDQIVQSLENLTTQLRELPTERLYQELTERLGLTAESLLRTACLVAILEERGKDLSGLKIGLLDHLRKIATGRLLPEIVVRFVDDGRTIRRLSELSLSEQQRVLDGESPDVVLRLEAREERRARNGHRASSGQRRKEEELAGQRPEDVVPKGSPRDVAEYLFGLVVKHDDPCAVMIQLERLFTEYKAGGKRRRIDLAEPE